MVSIDKLIDLPPINVLAADESWTFADFISSYQLMKLNLVIPFPLARFPARGVLKFCISRHREGFLSFLIPFY